MKKSKKCKHCSADLVIDYLCDTCGKNLLKEMLGIPITVDFSYGSPLDGEEYHFCKYQCLLQFILHELKKVNPINKQLEFGKEEKF